MWVRRFLRSGSCSVGGCGKTLSRELKKGRLPEVAEVIANLIPRFLQEDVVRKYFSLWEKHGFHLTPVDYYQPIPDTRELTPRLWERESELAGIDLNIDFQIDLLCNVFPKFIDEYNKFPQHATDNPNEFYFDNPMFSGTDALVLYCMVRHFRPNVIIEVGSGFSTRVASKAARYNGSTRIKCIEPWPDVGLRRLPHVEEVIATRVQEVGLDFFQELGQGDILFIDGSHTVKCGGDVNYLCLEVLPRLGKGVIVHFHDIFLPSEYPMNWVLDLHRFWGEQYLVQALLTFSSGLEILFLNSYMGLKHQEKMRRTFPRSPWWGGGSCWLRRRSKTS